MFWWSLVLEKLWANNFTAWTSLKTPGVVNSCTEPGVGLDDLEDPPPLTPMNKCPSRISLLILFPVSCNGVVCGKGGGRKEGKAFLKLCKRGSSMETIRFAFPTSVTEFGIQSWGSSYLLVLIRHVKRRLQHLGLDFAFFGFPRPLWGSGCDSHAKFVGIQLVFRFLDHFKQRWGRLKKPRFWVSVKNPPFLGLKDSQEALGMGKPIFNYQNILSKYEANFLCCRTRT